jgi:2-polyprenyl-6-methoxyphenol hydroxylase-like FAD-dependent oxidoreductase
MTKHPVVIAGGGLTGLMLAGELALATLNTEAPAASSTLRPRAPL